MSTLAEVITRVDALVENSYTNDQKTSWINDLNSKIYTDILLVSEYDYETLVYDTHSASELVVDPAHEEIYVSWLAAQIYLHQHEYTEYNAFIDIYNQQWENYMCYIAQTYEPANFDNKDSSLYYMRPAGTAVYTEEYSLTYEATSGTSYLVAEIPADSIIREVLVVIDTAFNSSGGDSIIIGTATDDDYFIGAGDIDETTASTTPYTKSFWVSSGTTGTSIYAKWTGTGDDATQGIARISVLYTQ